MHRYTIWVPVLVTRRSQEVIHTKYNVPFDVESDTDIDDIKVISRWREMICNAIHAGEQA